MKRAILLTLVIALLGAALFVAQRRHAHAAVSAAPILYLVADSERDLARLPSHFTRIPDKEEIAIGKSLAQRELGDRKLNADATAVEAYLNDVGRRMAPRAHRKLPFHIYYVADRDFDNAFALPGGPVFIGAGLIERMTTEDELAAVLAHEMEHIDHYHCAERLQVEAALRRIPLGQALAIPVAIFQAGYNKDQELEADREGVMLAARAGYSAAGALRAFEMLASMSREPEPSRTPQGEAARVTAGVLTGYFRSHPPAPDRVAQTRALIARQPEIAARPERPLAVEHVFLAFKSLDAVGDEKFALAEELAQRALRQRPGYHTALLALCEAEYGLDRNANAVYRQLDAPDAAAVETWGEARANELGNKKQYDRELTLVKALLEVQPAQQQLLRLAALAQAMKGDDAAAAATAATLRHLYADVAASFAAEAEKLAAESLDGREFAHGASMARLSLALDPQRRSANGKLGDAEFAQAHFDRAADAYKNAFDPNNSDADWLRKYAFALGAARPAAACAEMQTFLSQWSVKAFSDSFADVECAGLGVAARNDAKAREIVQLVDRGSIAPELLERLGWWYFHANRSADAETVLRKARSLRPADAQIENMLWWTMIEEGKPFEPTNASTPETIVENTPDVRDALAAWRFGRKAEAVRRWAAVTQSKPQWLNPAWRAALYPPKVNEVAQAVEGERQAIAARDRLRRAGAR